MSRVSRTLLMLVCLCAVFALLIPVVVRAEVVWSQPPDLHGFKATSEIIAIYGLDTRIADDFELESDATIRTLVFWGGYYDWTGEDPDPPFNIVFYSHFGCNPVDVLAAYDCLRAVRGFIGYDDYGDPTYEYTVDVDFAATANTRYWCLVQACDHPYPPLWGRQQSTVNPLCEAQYYMFGSPPEWMDMWDVFGVPWGASFELRTDTPTPVQPTTWGRIRSQFR
jgi:hypothetical protein